MIYLVFPGRTHPYNLHDLLQRMFPVLDLYVLQTNPAQPLATAGEELDDM